MATVNVNQWAKNEHPASNNLGSNNSMILPVCVETITIMDEMHGFNNIHTENSKTELPPACA